MAKYLLDIHTFLWWYKNALQLFKKVKDTLINPQNDFFISISSFWEIVIKQNAGKLKLTCELDNFVIACKKQNIQ